MAPHRVVVRFDLDPTPVGGVVIPVEQDRPERCYATVRNFPRPDRVLVPSLRQHASQRGQAGTHDIHRMRGGRNLLQNPLHLLGQAAHRAQIFLVFGQFGRVGEMTVNEQVSDLLIFTVLGQILDVIATVMQIVAAVADRAQGGCPSRDA